MKIIPSLNPMSWQFPLEKIFHICKVIPASTLGIHPTLDQGREELLRREDFLQDGSVLLRGFANLNKFSKRKLSCQSHWNLSVPKSYEVVKGEVWFCAKQNKHPVIFAIGRPFCRTPGYGNFGVALTIQRLKTYRYWNPEANPERDWCIVPYLSIGSFWPELLACSPFCGVKGGRFSFVTLKRLVCPQNQFVHASVRFSLGASCPLLCVVFLLSITLIQNYQAHSIIWEFGCANQSQVIMINLEQLISLFTRKSTTK